MAGVSSAPSHPARPRREAPGRQGAPARLFYKRLLGTYHPAPLRGLAALLLRGPRRAEWGARASGAPGGPPPTARRPRPERAPRAKGAGRAGRLACDPACAGIESAQAAFRDGGPCHLPAAPTPQRRSTAPPRPGGVRPQPNAARPDAKGRGGRRAGHGWPGRPAGWGCAGLRARGVAHKTRCASVRSRDAASAAWGRGEERRGQRGERLQDGAGRGKVYGSRVRGA